MKRGAGSLGEGEMRGEKVEGNEVLVFAALNSWLAIDVTLSGVSACKM